MKTVYKRNLSALIMLIILLMIFGGCKPKVTKGTVSPEEFGKAFVIATNKPDALALDSATLGGGEEYYKFAAKQENLSEKDYYLSISDNQADTYEEFLEYQNDFRRSYYESSYETVKVKTEFKDVKSESLSDNVLKKVKENYKEYTFLDTEKITEPYKISVKYVINISDHNIPGEVYILAVKYDGELKYVVSNKSEEEFDNGLE